MLVVARGGHTQQRGHAGDIEGGVLCGHELKAAHFGFSDATYTSEQYNGVITAWVTNPATANALAKLKTGSDRTTPLLHADPTQPGKRQILGVPLLTSPYVATTNSPVWGIPKADRHWVVRENAEVESDPSVFFTSDRVAVRAVVRQGFGLPNSPAIVKISTSA